jgi:anaerobic magnesium-protoporphyrin IX monomethyl ester cyclase
MPNVVFIDAPTTPQDRIGKLSQFIDLSRDRPHLGILLLAAVARESGWEVKVIDPYPFQWSDDEIARQVREFRADVIGISSHTLGIINANRLAGLLKSHLPRVPILIGGPHVTSAAKLTLQEFPHFDYAVVGEGEETLVELLPALQRDATGEELEKIDGIAFRARDRGVVLTPRRRYRMDLDTLPMPAWDLLPQYPFMYSPAVSFGSGTRLTGSLFSTRGCPWRCRFCDRGVFGDTLRTFSAAYVMKQVLHLYHEYGVREIMFGDDTLLADTQRMYELAELLIDAKLDLKWECMARVVDADEELYPLLKRSGCFEISYGIESADDRVSKLVSKPINQESVRRAIAITKQAGIKVRGYFIFGLPGETKETLATTSNFILTSGLDAAAIFACTPYPGSALFEMAPQYGSFERRWNKMNNVETVFVPHGLTAEYIEAMRLRTMKKFYLNPRYVFNWTRTLIREDGWKEIGRRSRVYARFFANAVGESLAGLGRGA